MRCYLRHHLSALTQIRLPELRILIAVAKNKQDPMATAIKVLGLLVFKYLIIFPEKHLKMLNQCGMTFGNLKELLF